MNIVVLSGGSGQRLWPLSNNIKSKQFIGLFKNEAGDYTSMVQRVYSQLLQYCPEAKIVFVASMEQKGIIQKQLGSDVCVLVEPDRRNTFAAISLAAAYFAGDLHVPLSSSITVMPVDPYVERDYFNTLCTMSKYADTGKSDIVLMGIEASSPSTELGYMIVGEKGENGAREVKRFVEKPDYLEAQNLIKLGAYWNGGVFSFQLDYAMGIISRQLCVPKEFIDANIVSSNYSRFEKTSFDYAVVEKANRICMFGYSGTWRDLGTWNAISEVADIESSDSVEMIDCNDTTIINNSSCPLIAIGISNAVIVASSEGIFVSDKEKSTKVKEASSILERPPRLIEHLWGTEKILYPMNTYTYEVSILHIDNESSVSFTIIENTYSITVAHGGCRIISPALIKHKLTVGSSIKLAEKGEYTIRTESECVLVRTIISPCKKY